MAKRRRGRTGDQQSGNHPETSAPQGDAASVIEVPTPETDNHPSVIEALPRVDQGEPVMAIQSVHEASETSFGAKPSFDASGPTTAEGTSPALVSAISDPDVSKAEEPAEAAAVSTEALPTVPPAAEEDPAPGIMVPATREFAGLPDAVAVSPAPVAALGAIGQFSEVNATLAAFLRNEGNAAFAHWRALSGAKSPADLIRLQVDELQRAADASLSCIARLAKQAGQIAAARGRA